MFGGGARCPSIGTYDDEEFDTKLEFQEGFHIANVQFRTGKNEYGFEL